MKKHPLVKKILFSSKDITKKTKQVAEKIAKYYNGIKVKENTVLVLGLLKGCVPFFAEFIKHFSYECETEFMVVSSYNGGTKTSGEPKIVLDINTPLKDREVLIVDDVIDTGITIDYIKRYLLNRGAKSVKVLTMIDKQGNRTKKQGPDWTCFKVKSGFLIGFGLDYQERLRNLPYVGVADEEKLKDWKWD